MGYENSGRRPQPSALKVLRGNPGRRKPNPHEPKPPEGVVVVPESLSVAAKAVWAELAPVCLAMGTLTVADIRPFATLCELQATLQQASSQKDVPTTAQAGIKLEKELAPIVRPFYELFGLTPSARARIQVPKKVDEPASKWAGVLS